MLLGLRNGLCNQRFSICREKVTLGMPARSRVCSRCCNTAAGSSLVMPTHLQNVQLELGLPQLLLRPALLETDAFCSLYSFHSSKLQFACKRNRDCSLLYATRMHAAPHCIIACWYAINYYWVLHSTLLILELAAPEFSGSSTVWIYLKVLIVVVVQNSSLYFSTYYPVSGLRHSVNSYTYHKK